MAGLSDTSLEAERVLIEVYQRMPMSEKWRQMGQIFRTAKNLHAAGVRFRCPNASDEDVRQAWLRQTLGPGPARTVQG